jgi:hypothetical protein
VGLFKNRLVVTDAEFHPRLGFHLSNVTSAAQRGDYVCKFTSVYKQVEMKAF